MIRVRLADPQYRQTIATFLRQANLSVTCPEGDALTLFVDLDPYDFDDEAQVEIMTQVLEAWRDGAAECRISGTEIAVA